jgi:hypothetical protein
MILLLQPAIAVPVEAPLTDIIAEGVAHQTLVFELITIGVRHEAAIQVKV